MVKKYCGILCRSPSGNLDISLFDDSYHVHNGVMSESEYVYIQARFEQLAPEC
ncbi:hypothetical protein [Shewanella sp.]|uniref:hypothetical protein n=1 Tax=Shewanella sp. TaxID=50422 RepID=UPI00258B8298|nr:hypothetical protein [Shewanella sp.]MCJ8302841.1 hypothetical protein [Shewanella sp.]